MKRGQALTFHKKAKAKAVKMILGDCNISRNIQAV